jgi:hypothetical protein
MNMSAIEIVKQAPLTAQEVELVGGGMCDANQILQLTKNLTAAYENLVAFASHIIGRVAGDPE